MSKEANWARMKSGYRLPYDPRSAVSKLLHDPLDKDAWDELWNELHHQGDVDEASYAAVPLLLEVCSTSVRDWNFYALIALIELERHRSQNPQLPDWLKDSYHIALEEAKSLALSDLLNSTDMVLMKSAMAVVALAGGNRKLGALLIHIDDSELDNMLEELLAWSKVYQN
jgi:hypothetical protein